MTFSPNFDVACDLSGFVRDKKTWKVMEFLISISRPEKSWNLSEGHGKSWKSNMLSENKKAKRQKIEKSTDLSETDLYFDRERHKHTFYEL